MAHTIAFHLIKTSRKLQNALGFKSDVLSLSPSQASALLVIDSQKDANQAEISLKLHLKPASIVTLIDELEKLKLVTRKTPKSDRRKYIIKLTEEGIRKVKKIRARTQEIEKYIRSKLTSQEVQILFSALDKLGQDPNLNHHLSNPKTKFRKEVNHESTAAKQHVAS